jgi:hypothetical protein
VLAAGLTIANAIVTSSKYAGASSTSYFSVFRKVARTSAEASSMGTS